MPRPKLRHLAAIAVAASALAVGSTGTAPAQSSLSEQRDALRARVAEESRRIASTSAGLADAEARLAALDDRVARLTAQLREAQDQLVITRARLARLERRAAEANDVLSANLVDNYKAGEPNVVTVVLDSGGFPDLLNRLSYFRRVAADNARILDAVRDARAEVAREKAELERQRERYSELANIAIDQRERANVIRNALLQRQAAQIEARDGTAAELQDVQARIRRIEREQAAAARRAASAATATDEAPAAPAPAPGPAADSSGVVAQVIAAANEIATTPYVYGGGHGSITSGYDCSGSISYALAAAGLLSSPLDSTGFMSWGEPGVGQHITVYANSGHAYMVVDGRRFDTSALSGGGTRWTSEMRSSAGFVARHPPGL
jgi:cell wall-associated NlpC family hydrolase